MAPSPYFPARPWPLYRLIRPAGTADWAEQDADLYAASVSPLLTLYGFLPPDTSPQLLLTRDCISLRLYDPALGAQLQSHSAHGTAPAGPEEIALELRRLTGTPCGEALWPVPPVRAHPVRKRDGATSPFFSCAAPFPMDCPWSAARPHSGADTGAAGLRPSLCKYPGISELKGSGVDFPLCPC